MKNYHFNHDFGRMMDKIFEATQKCGKVWQDELSEVCKGFPFTVNGFMDFYPSYSYPPFNSYLDKDKKLVFEFALAGFLEKDINLSFQGDYLLFSAKAPERMAEDPLSYFKRRLKFKDISDLKYYVPKERFDQNAVNAIFKNGLLTVIIPSKKESSKKETIKVKIVNIVNEDK